MKDELVVPHPIDPVYLKVGQGSVQIRVGARRRGEGRFAVLSPRDARILAYALLRAAESCATLH